MGVGASAGESRPACGHGRGASPCCCWAAADLSVREARAACSGRASDSADGLIRYARGRAAGRPAPTASRRLAERRGDSARAEHLRRLGNCRLVASRLGVATCSVSIAHADALAEAVRAGRRWPRRGDGARATRRPRRRRRAGAGAGCRGSAGRIACARPMTSGVIAAGGRHSCALVSRQGAAAGARTIADSWATATAESRDTPAADRRRTRFHAGHDGHGALVRRRAWR